MKTNKLINFIGTVLILDPPSQQLKTHKTLDVMHIIAVYVILESKHFQNRF